MMKKSVLIKNHLGICGCRWCLRKSKLTVKFPALGYVNDVCQKHYEELFLGNPNTKKEQK